MTFARMPEKQGLYDPAYEHDSCGVGCVVDLNNRPSHDIVDKAIQVLLHLEHRGACGCEPNTGDGAGILIQTPHKFLARECDRLGIKLPKPYQYGVGMVFLPTNASDRAACKNIIEQIVQEEGQTLLGWREVPTNNELLGPTARAAEPVIAQVFVKAENIKPFGPDDDLAFERKLYVIRRRIENAVRASEIEQRWMFYIPSFFVQDPDL
ncbi:MAG: hypothetical protein KatS3mg105_3361 [Gemmatales bacterium]|nr:MAG: hypothetical protein KatS3mg105_3361 [Gemmatales bacterium]